ncbi:hypothetical protein SLEP1_g56139 [Rubroshorea leprosula]|uniref:Uncharacterized protein n=1 Tax=Rubroshorea leprosula TaxID=152421 RepID=A0AAV5MHX4_9ROSI|nr:hypothetical protein SLEP1_g56139 [Rubroshorea leprosula]
MPYEIVSSFNLLLQVKWGESSMIEAERLFLAGALEDPANQTFVLLSDTFVKLRQVVLPFTVLAIYASI